MIEIDNLYNHQKEYYNELVKKKNEFNAFHALICIPTGGGKTRLAVTYAINEVLDYGKKILWITHSQYLLDQAYETFEYYKTSKWMSKNVILINSSANKV